MLAFARHNVTLFCMETNRIPGTGIIPRDEAMALLADLLPVFRDCLDQSWQFVEQVFDEAPERRAAFTPTTRANMLYDRLVQMVRQALDGHPRIQLAHRGRMLRLIVDQRVLVRFKKLDEDLRARNVRTDSQLLDYYQLWLPGIEEPALTKLTFGYRLNATQTEIVGRYLTCPKNWKENHWFAALDEEASDAMPLFIPRPQSDADSGVGIVVTPKRAAPKKGTASA